MMRWLFHPKSELDKARRDLAVTVTVLAVCWWGFPTLVLWLTHR